MAAVVGKYAAKKVLKGKMSKYQPEGGNVSRPPLSELNI